MTNVQPAANTGAEQSATNASAGHQNINIRPEIVPVFYYPAASWSRAVRHILTAANIDVADAARTQGIYPYVLTKLPQQIIDIVPHGTLNDLLNFLSSYDAPIDTWQSAQMPRNTSEGPRFNTGRRFSCSGKSCQNIAMTTP